MNMTSPRKILNNARRVVVKIGSALLTNEARDRVNQAWVDDLAAAVQGMRERGCDVIIVSSGGVALGRPFIGISSAMPPSSIPLEQKQAASSIGQFYVFQAYHNAFQKCGVETAQVLLTMSETENRRAHLNARETMGVLLERGVIPVINENDAISTEEIRFGDNDRLAARTAQMMDADCLVLLSTIDGLYDDNPHVNPNAKHIALVENIDDTHRDMAGEALPGLSTGGMKSKLIAADTAMRTGVHTIIADGREIGALRDLLEKDDVRATVFLAQKTDKNARKRWISSHLKPKGWVVIDDGALHALRRGGSLLPVGVTDVEGDFERGDVIQIKSSSGDIMGRGISAFSAADAKKLQGRTSTDMPQILGYIGREELIHRNDMVFQS